MISKDEKFDLVKNDLSRNSLQRSLSLNNEHLLRIGYRGNRTSTASTSLSTTSVPQNSPKSTSVIRDSVLESTSYHAQNGKNGYLFF